MRVDTDAARDLVTELVGAGSARWYHSYAAGEAASDITRLLPAEERHLLVAAAWLHDIGYHHPAPPTGFHPIDGALLLLDRGWPPRIAALVAHHSEARFTAAARGLLAEIGRFPREEGPVTDGLVYADMSAAPHGGRVTLHERLADVRHRHALDPAELQRARGLREPFLVLAVARCEVRIRRHGGAPARALPVSPTYLPAEGDVEVLAAEHPLRPRLDLLAALHAAASSAFADKVASSERALDPARHLLATTRPLLADLLHG